MNKTLTFVIILLVFTSSIVISYFIYKNKIKSGCKEAFADLHNQLDGETSTLIKYNQILNQLKISQAYFKKYPEYVGFTD